MKEANLLKKWSNRIALEAGKLWSPQTETCLCCTRPRSEKSGRLKLCLNCLAEIPWIQHVECKVCGRDETCADCARRKSQSFTANRSMVRYDATVKEWLALYKYRGHERIGELFGEWMAIAYERWLKEFAMNKEDILCISYVPLSKERLEDRGFNQAEVIARRLSERYRIPLADLLLRTRHTEKQSYKTRAERIRDLHGVFAFNESSWSSFQSQQDSQIESGVGYARGKQTDDPNRQCREDSQLFTQPLNILLIDDVYTTGSTLEECAKAIRLHINCAVYGLTLAR